MVEKLKSLIQMVESQKGPITLFMLWKDAPEIDKWTVLVSAPWIDKLDQRVAINFWVDALQANLSKNELEAISRVSLLQTKDKFVRFFVRVLKVAGGSIRLTKTQLGDYFISDALVFEAKDSTDKTPIGSPTRNPKFNSSINPKFNSSINPKFNSSINPKFNSSINPKFNSSINPKFNSSINPKFNSSINPKFNSSINPKFNSSINPKFNSSINPTFNYAFAGPVLYDLNLKQEAYFVSAGDNVLLMFNFRNDFTGYCISSSESFLNVFDDSGAWVGYLISNGQGGYNYFSTEGTWNGFIA